MVQPNRRICQSPAGASHLSTPFGVEIGSQVNHVRRVRVLLAGRGGKFLEQRRGVGVENGSSVLSSAFSRQFFSGGCGG